MKIYNQINHQGKYSAITELPVSTLFDSQISNNLDSLQKEDIHHILNSTPSDHTAIYQYHLSMFRHSIFGADHEKTFKRHIKPNLFIQVCRERRN